MSDKKKKPPTDEQPAYWFALLDLARERGEFIKAATAQRELERLGVRVKYTQARKAVANAR